MKYKDFPATFLALQNLKNPRLKQTGEQPTSRIRTCNRFSFSCAGCRRFSTPPKIKRLKLI